MPTYIAREPIEHDGVRTEPEGELKLTEGQAAPLLAIGHIVPKPGKAAHKAADPAPASDATPPADAAGSAGGQTA